MKPLLSSPDPEKYLDHIKRTSNELDVVMRYYEPTLNRVIGSVDLIDSLRDMVLFHDIGKLTARWQDCVGTVRTLPAHAPIGAAYLWKRIKKNLREPICFAVAIHHVDRGLVGDNIEKPDVQAINDGVVDHATNKIAWDERALVLDPKYFPKGLAALSLNDLRDMARGLRLWARGCDFLEQHTRRVQAMLAHHVLKLSDISAASKRRSLKENESKQYFGGWLMTEQITNYVDSLQMRKAGDKR